MNYTVTLIEATAIPGYTPEYTMASGLTWEGAYDFAVGLAKGVVSPTNLKTYDYEAFHTQLRDGATEATLVVTSRQQGVHLGRPFTPQVLATYRVARA